MIIRGGCASDVGSSRTVNQDAIFYRQQMQGKEEFALCAVCDGVGGLEHGEVASAFLVTRMEAWFEETVAWMDIGRADSGLLFSHLKDAAESWNEEIRQLCRERNLKTGSTMSILCLLRDKYYIIHVGDSRIYRCRGKGLEQLTVDDSVARLKAGRMKNYLSNYMGKEETLWFQALEGSVESGDLFLVCSDGLYHQLGEQDISELLQLHKKNSNIDEICRHMIRLMISRGESDNISLGAVAVAQRRERLLRRLRNG